MSDLTLTPEGVCCFQASCYEGDAAQRAARPRRVKPGEKPPLVYFDLKTSSDLLDQLTLAKPKYSLTGTPPHHPTRRDHLLQLQAYLYALEGLAEAEPTLAPTTPLGPRQRLSPLAARQ